MGRRKARNVGGQAQSIEPRLQIVAAASRLANEAPPSVERTMILEECYRVLCRCPTKLLVSWLPIFCEYAEHDPVLRVILERRPPQC